MRKQIKKGMAILVTTALVMSLAGCGGKSKAAGNETQCGGYDADQLELD